MSSVLRTVILTNRRAASCGHMEKVKHVVTLCLIIFVGVLGLCADSGPECLIFGGVSVLLLLPALVTVCVAMVCARRQRQQVGSRWSGVCGD